MYFCDNVTHRHKDKREFLGKCLTKDAENSIESAAYAIYDVEMLTKIGKVDLIAKEVKCHHSCSKSYGNKAGEKDCSGQDQSEVTKVFT